MLNEVKSASGGESTNNPQAGGDGQSPSSLEPRPKSKLAKYLIGLIILGAVGWGIYYLKTQNSNVKTTTQNVSTKNWKTHENKEFGFSFQYPSNFELEEKRVDESVTVQVGKLRKSDTPVKLFDDNSFSITYPASISKLLPFDLKFMEYEYNQGLQRTGSACLDSLPPSCMSIFKEVNKEKYFKLGFRNHSELIDQILSTFKFTP